jgi:hypothetical protein
MGSPPRHHRAKRICRTTENFVRSMWIRTSGGGVSAWPWCRPLVPAIFGLGFRNAVLWVLAGNVRADGFYRIDRWVPDGLRRTDSVWGVTVDEVRYRRGL